MNNREANLNPHPPTCTCKACCAERSRRLFQNYTNVPFGGGNNVSERGVSTEDAANKGLLKWNYKKGIYELPDITLPKRTKTKINKLDSDNNNHKISKTNFIKLIIIATLVFIVIIVFCIYVHSSK